MSQFGPGVWAVGGGGTGVPEIWGMLALYFDHFCSIWFKYKHVLIIESACLVFN